MKYHTELWIMKMHHLFGHGTLNRYEDKCLAFKKVKSELQEEDDEHLTRHQFCGKLYEGYTRAQAWHESTMSRKYKQEHRLQDRQSHLLLLLGNEKALGGPVSALSVEKSRGEQR